MPNPFLVDDLPESGNPFLVDDLPESGNPFLQEFNPDGGHQQMFAPPSKKDWKTAFGEVRTNPLHYLPFLNLYDLVELGDLYTASKKMAEGIATPAEERLVMDKLQDDRRERTFGYNVLSIALQIPAFAGEFFTGTVALTKGGKFLAKQGAKVGTKYAMGKTVERVGKYFANEVTKKGAEKLAKRSLRKKFADVTKRAAIEAIPRTALMSHQVRIDQIRNMTPKFALTNNEVGEVEAILMDPGDDFFPALAKAYADTGIEMFSEQIGAHLSFLGEYLDPKLGISAMKAAVLNRVSKRFPGGVKSAVKAYGATVGRFGKKMGWHGILGEMYEERIGGALRFATPGLEGELFPSFEQLATEAVAFALNPLVVGGMSYSAAQDAVQDDAYDARQQIVFDLFERDHMVKTGEEYDELLTRMAANFEGERSDFWYKAWKPIKKMIGGPAAGDLTSALSVGRRGMNQLREVYDEAEDKQKGSGINAIDDWLFDTLSLAIAPDAEAKAKEIAKRVAGEDFVAGGRVLPATESRESFLARANAAFDAAEAEAPILPAVETELTVAEPAPSDTIPAEPVTTPSAVAEALELVPDDQLPEGREAQKTAVEGYFAEGRPVTASSVASTGAAVPLGYTREGDVYVPPAPPAAPDAVRETANPYANERGENTGRLSKQWQHGFDGDTPSRATEVKGTLANKAFREGVAARAKATPDAVRETPAEKPKQKKGIVNKVTKKDTTEQGRSNIRDEYVKGIAVVPAGNEGRTEFVAAIPRTHWAPAGTGTAWDVALERAKELGAASQDATDISALGEVLQGRVQTIESAEAQETKRWEDMADDAADQRIREDIAAGRLPDSQDRKLHTKIYKEVLDELGVNPADLKKPEKVPKAERLKTAIPTTINELKTVLNDRMTDVYFKQREVRQYIESNLPPEIQKKATARIEKLATYAKPETRQKYVDEAKKLVDSLQEKNAKREALQLAQSVAAREYRRLHRAQGKGGSKLDQDANDAALELLDSVTLTFEEKSETFKTEVGEYPGKDKDDDLKAIIDKQLTYYDLHPNAQLSDKFNHQYGNLFRDKLAAMDTEQLNEFLSELSFIKEQGRWRWQRDRDLQVMAEDSEARLAVAAMEHAGVTEKDEQLDKALEGSDKGDVLYVKKMAKEYGWGLIRPERIAHWFEAWDKARAVFNNTFQKIVDSDQAKQRNMEETEKAFSRIHAGIDMGKAQGEIIYTFELEGKTRKMSLANMMHVYANSKSASGRLHLVGTGLSEELIEDIAKATPISGKNAVEKWMDWWRKNRFPQVDAQFAREHNVHMTELPNWFPLLNLEGNSTSSMMVGDQLARRESTLPSVDKAHTKQRMLSKAPFRRMDYFGTVIESIGMIEHYLSYSQSVAEVSSFMRRPDVKDAMTGRSEEAYVQMVDWLQTASYGRVRRVDNTIDKISEFLRHNYVLSVLGYNLVSAMLQPASFIQGLGRLTNTGDMGKVITDFWHKPSAMIEDVKKRSTMMKNRGRQLERELAEMYEKHSVKRLLGTESAWAKFKEESMTPIRAADRVTTTLLWTAQYRASLNEGVGEEAAVVAADELVRNTQPMGGIVHLPKLMRAGGIVRAYSQFKNQLNHTDNQIFEIFTKGEGAKANIYQMFMQIVIPAIIVYMIRHGLKPPDDPEKIAGAIVDQVTGGLPVFDKLGKSVMMNLTGDKQGAWFLLSLTPTSMQPLEDLFKAVAFNNPDDLFNAAAKISGVPWTQVRRTYKGVDKFVDTKDPRYLAWSEFALKD